MYAFVKTIRASKFGLQTCRSARTFVSSHPLNIKVAICGACGGVGQATALLLKMSPHISEIAVYDIVNSEGVAVDLSHINTNSRVTYYDKPTLLLNALEKSDIILLTAGKPRRQADVLRADLFYENVNIVRETSEAMARASPNAMLCIITNPVNIVLPVAADTLKKGNAYDPRRLFGITTLDLVRASTFAAEAACLDATKLIVPVIGGHSGRTCVPLFSQASSKLNLSKDKWKELVYRVQYGGIEIIKAKAGEGSCTLAMGYAAARFIFALCRALKGEKNIIECAMVESDITDAKFFATPLILSNRGVERNLGFGKVTDDECGLINVAVERLVQEIAQGTAYTIPGAQKRKEPAKENIVKQPPKEDTKPK